MFNTVHKYIYKAVNSEVTDFNAQYMTSSARGLPIKIKQETFAECRVWELALEVFRCKCSKDKVII